MKKSINDATLQKAGDTYQFLIALRDCFRMNANDKIKIEIDGDVSLLSELSQNSFQKEVKHHFVDKNLSERDIDFWKTLSNWYKEYIRINEYTSLILHTTARIFNDSPFIDWDSKNEREKLLILKNIGLITRHKEETFREQYNYIFGENYDETKILNILSKFKIEHSQNKIVNISLEFNHYIGHIPNENRDAYIGALLGQIAIKVKNYPHEWIVTREDFDKILRQSSPSFSEPNIIPLNTEFADEIIPQTTMMALENKNFVTAIKNIEHDSKIPSAKSNYWKANMTIIKYFQDDFLYTESIPSYKTTLKTRLNYTKENKVLEMSNNDRTTLLKYSKILYNEVMTWRAEDFGSIVRNQDYFQQGIIHTIVDENEFNWDVGDNNEP